MSRKISEQFGSQGKASRKDAVRRQDSPGKEITFDSLRNSIHPVVNTIQGQFHCWSFPNCDDLK